MTPLRRRLPLIALSLAVALPLTLSGCSAGSQQPGSGSSAAAPGAGSVGSGKVPSDFPKDVPLAAGDVVTGASTGSGDKEIWTVDIKVADVNAIDGIQSQLNAAGFSTEAGAIEKTDTGAGGEFNGSKYDVLVEIAKGDNGWVADYSVTAAAN